MKRLLFLCIILSANVLYASAQVQDREDAEDYVLVLCSSSKEHSRANYLMEQLQPLTDRLQYKLLFFNVQSGLVTTNEHILDIQDSLRNTFPTKPKLVISIWEPAWQISRDLFDNEWKDVPTIIFMGNEKMVKDYHSLIDYEITYLPEILYPCKEVVKDYNLTIIEYPSYYSSTISLMKEVIPSIKKIAYITDSRHLSKLELVDFKASMKDDYPEMAVDILQYPTISTDKLMDTLTKYDNSVGLIYYSWYATMTGEGYGSDGHIQSVLTAISTTPVFNVWDKIEYNIDFGGGVYIPIKKCSDKCLEIARKILEDGVKASDIPFCIGGTSQRYLNIPSLLTHNVDIFTINPKAIYLNMPPTLWERYRFYYIASFSIFVLVFILILLMFRNKSKEAKLMTRHNAEIDSLNKRLEIIINTAKMSIWRLDVTKRELEIRYDYLGGELASSKQPHLTDISSFYQAIHPDDVELIQTGYIALLNSSIEYFDREYRLKIPGESNYKWVESYAAINERDSMGTPMSLVGATIIVDERKKMESKLRNAKDRAENANKLKNQFLANMSHEIRTPLNSIIGFSRFLAEGECSKEEKMEYASIIEKNNKLLLQLINDILELSEIESETVNLTEEKLDLNDIVQQIYESAMLLEHKPEVSILYSLPKKATKLSLDKDKVIQVYNHLIINALKFTTKGSVTIGYENHQQSIYFYVSDTGPGIPEKDRGSIFQRFVKLNSFSQGTGLGLTICKSLVELMGGLIGVDSRMGLGSRFWFTIPNE